jgi:hypothetical protein
MREKLIYRLEILSWLLLVLLWLLLAGYLIARSFR